MSALISSLRGVALGGELEVDQRDIGGRHADRGAVELALQAPAAPGPAPCAAPVEVGIIVSAAARARRRSLCSVSTVVLVAGIGMDRRHVAVLDADALVEDIGDGRQAIGRAGAVRDDRVLARSAVAVDAHDEGEIDAVGRAPRRCTLLAPASRCFAAASRLVKKPGAFQRHIDLEVSSTAASPGRARRGRAILPRPTSIQLSPVLISPRKRPCTLSYFRRCALASTEPRSLIATTWRSSRRCS